MGECIINGSVAADSVYGAATAVLRFDLTRATRTLALAIGALSLALSILAGILTIPVIGWVGWRTFGPPAGVAAAALRGRCQTVQARLKARLRL